jgi:hypothetical protein
MAEEKVRVEEQGHVVAVCRRPRKTFFTAHIGKPDEGVYVFSST